jgi:hypothetical protein
MAMAIQKIAWRVVIAVRSMFGDWKDSHKKHEKTQKRICLLLGVDFLN